jgi:hypothetical protein
MSPEPKTETRIVVPPGVSGLLTGGLVDVTEFADKPVIYEIEDVKGEDHDIPMPRDLPLPMALAIMVAHDEFDAAIPEGNEAIAKAWTRLLEVFAVAVQIRNPDWTGKRLETDIGENQMLAWVNIVIERLKFQQTQLSLEQYLREQLQPPDPDKAGKDPKAPSSGSSS